MAETPDVYALAAAFQRGLAAGYLYAAGVEGSSVSVLSGVTIGSALRIETLTSHGLVPAAPGDPVGSASTVVAGASVNGTPAGITHAGLEVGDQTPAEEPKAQLMSPARQALAADDIEDVRLDEATATPQADGVSRLCRCRT